MALKYWYTTPQGIRRYTEDGDDGAMTVASVQEVGSILDRNRAMANHNDGYTPSREMRRVASIPLSLIIEWREKEGWDAFNPDHADRLARKLNDIDYLWLRTAEGQVAPLADGGLR